MTLPHSTSDVFAAVVKTVESGKFHVVDIDLAAFRIAFVSGKTALSWGNEYVATASSEPKGTLLEVLCGGLDAAPKALLDKWKHGKTADKTLAAIQGNIA